MYLRCSGLRHLSRTSLGTVLLPEALHMETLDRKQTSLCFWLISRTCETQKNPAETKTEQVLKTA